MSHNLISRRRRTLVASATIALMCLAPNAQASGGDHDVQKPRQDHASDTQAANRNADKTITVKEQKRLISAAKKNEAAVARQIGLPGSQGLRATDVVQDADGAQHTRYQRTYQGMRVIGGDMIVHTDAKGAVQDVQHASRQKVAPASTTAKVSRATAIRKAERTATFKATSSSSVLVVFAGDNGERLAYDTVVKGVKKDQTPSRLHVVVDAQTGKTLASWDEIHSADGEGIFVGTVDIDTRSTGSGYEMVDTVRGNGRTIDLRNAQSGGTVMTDSDDHWGNGTMSDPDSAGVDAHYGAAQTWDYFLDKHGRHGIFDDGVGVPSRVHYGNNYVNAFWDGQQMTYGDGDGNQNPLTELDVAGHEMSHGVTEATAGLVYYGDAGGLNESTSDIFGTSVEFNANNAADVGDYLIGEEIDINGNGTPLRYMDKPSRDGASYDCWTSSMGNDDPHYTSGPGNHFFYLASEGSGSKVINGVSYNSPTCDGSSFDGIGRDKVEQVWFKALDAYMTSTTTYPEARDATVRAAMDIYGADSPECAGVEAAWDGVDVPQNDFACSSDGGTDPDPDPGTGECADLALSESGTLSRSNDYEYEPGSSGYYTSSSAGTHTACIDGPDGTDFDLYLEKWNGSQWVRVASSLSSGSHEEISYSGTAGSYSYVVQSYRGSGSYTMRYAKP
ncbi:M4 family metallopeptidase [Nocardioides sp. JQ2195]|uniref:M4 family metallopeptidase n=1 Tax=Nocardioides sp. JQ2195 TaxID=2592334 RepID=UPI00143E975C|nr:M4 family metallopeptidase [Nocardioides sp. JQ2195]QIX25654.1 M4 family metallopeptidase [Nocardioides sp. JQ2195]